jgi:hypothetical protein
MSLLVLRVNSLHVTLGLIAVLLFSGCNSENKGAQRVERTPLQQCLAEVDREDTKCRLISFGGMSGLRQNPNVVAQCRQIKLQETEFCYRRFD